MRLSRPGRPVGAAGQSFTPLPAEYPPHSRDGDGRAGVDGPGEARDGRGGAAGV